MKARVQMTKQAQVPTELIIPIAHKENITLNIKKSLEFAAGDGITDLHGALKHVFTLTLAEKIHLSDEQKRLASKNFSGSWRIFFTKCLDL